MNGELWDAAIVGGGPAGLAGALWLGRYRRRVLLLDDARPRNEAAWAVHGYPGIPDPKPAELRRRIREQAIDAGALIERRTIARIGGEKERFALYDDGDSASFARRVLLTYGRHDRMPELPGLTPLYGTSVFHCPDCDGPAVTGGRVAVLGHDRQAAGLALYLLTWADRSILLTNGMEPALEPDTRATLEGYGVVVETRTVTRLDGHDGRLRAARVEGGEVPLDSLFFHWGSHPASALGPATGCACDPDGNLEVDTTLETSVPGIYAAGDIVGRPHLVISAAAGGVRAALSIHRSLLPSEFQL